MTWQYQTRNVFIQFWPLWLSKLAWGMFWGAWEAMVPTVQRRIALTDAQMGEQLIVVIVGVLPAIFLGGRLWTKLGKFQLPLSLLIYAWGTAWLGHVQSAKELGQALLVVGVASGLLKVTLACMIACAQEITGQKMFSYGQALFPLAVVVAAPAVGLMRREGIDATAIFDVLAVFLVASAIAASLTSLQFPQIKVAVTRPRAGRVPGAALVVISAMGFFFYVLEHAINQWSTLFLQRNLGVDPFLASWGPSVYMGAAYVGRMTAYRLGHQLSDLHITLFGFLAGAVVMLWVSFAADPWSALAGYLVAGLLMSPAIPAVYNLATQFSLPETRMQSLSNMSTIRNLGYLISPLLFGLTLSAYGMRNSWRLMSLIALLCLASLRLAQIGGVFRPKLAVSRQPT
ncbi:MAG: hypothetical protein PPHEINF_5116 [uncultured Paraburkholderia sp.]|nr:MAG: hypothetical protein PPHEINF_5116 [uncultured Paraburkholderia sp.]CAH2803575.1 MAG: hypothetical protein PPHEESC_5158 [uncultured Paraburkholderia sp.]CAH2938313.1 MAG: hypothetical protein PPHEMADMSA_5104 [uncultured Paraburkholderia sp.]CAH2940454.1 MAG: hypothetical protein PPHERAN_5111 [uncultured Paraburkholderia sp.]